MEKEGLLLDNVESSWRGILDMTVNDADKTLYGLTSTPVYFGLWAAPLEEMRFTDNTGKIHYEIKKGLAAKKPSTNNIGANPPNFNNNPSNAQQLNKNLMQIAEAQKILQQKNIDIDLNNILGNYFENRNNEQQFSNQNPENNFDSPKKDVFNEKVDSPPKKLDEKYIENINNVIKNNIMNPPRPFAKKKNEEQLKAPLENPTRNDDPIRPVEIYMNPIEDETRLTPEKNFNKPFVNNIINNENEEEDYIPKKSEQNVHKKEPIKGNINYEEIKDKEFENSIINPQNTTLSNELHFSSFIIDKDNNEKYQQFDLINELSKEHSKFVSVLNTRSNYIKPIVHYLNAGNIKSALFLLNKYLK